ncbi:hypothetical protein HED60_18855 [Planctomycetales bacterium ZRK34]|nr:hypothetical protein HED60_18855 [Planctomycetales bacterium ZRK34]
MMHRRFRLAAIAVCLATVGAFVLTLTSSAYGQTARLGMNLAGPADWMTELPFVDVFRTSRRWISQKQGAGWGKGPELAIDEHGWVKRLEPGCFAETMLCTISGGHYPSGVYTVLYEGEGKLEPGMNAKLKQAEPGRMLIEIDSSRGGFSLRLRETNPQNPVRNIHVIMPGFEDTWRDDPFHPVFLRQWKGFACYRFMDWMHTNGSEIATWSDRPTPDSATFSKRGVALEWMIDLCNRQHVDPWFCMPHLADDDFVRRFAEMVKQKLDPSLKIYIEYSNEVWNGQFAQSRYAGEQGVKLGLGPADKPWEAGWHYTAVRSMEIFEIWEQVFGGRDQLVRVLPSQAANSYVSEQILKYRDAAKHADALAIAPYISYNIGRGKTAELGKQMADWSVDQMLDHFEKTAMPQCIGWIEKSKAVADKYGVKLIAYEGGQHMVAFMPDRHLVDKVSATMHAANRHPRMGQIYKRYYDAWERLGGDVFAVFSSIGRYSKYGAWGLAEYYDSSPADYPKLQATLQWAREHGQPVAE